MLDCLLVKNKVCFIDGTCLREFVPIAETFGCDCCNPCVKIWIINSIYRELTTTMQCMPTALAVWRDLKQRYDKVDGTRIFQLHRTICTAQRGSSTITEHFSRLQSLWAEAEALVRFGLTQEFLTHLDQQKLFQFLFVLNESF